MCMRTPAVLFLTVMIMTVANHLAAQTASTTYTPNTTTYSATNSPPVGRIDSAANIPLPGSYPPPAYVPPAPPAGTIMPTAVPVPPPVTNQIPGSVPPTVPPMVPPTTEPVATVILPTYTNSPVPPNATAERTIQTIPVTYLHPPIISPATENIHTSPTTTATSVSIPPTTTDQIQQLNQLNQLNYSTRVLDKASQSVEAGVRAVTHESGPSEADMRAVPPVITQADAVRIHAVHQAVVENVVSPPLDDTTGGIPAAPNDTHADLPPLESRVVSEIVAQSKDALTQVRDELNKRGGLALYTDSDNDGVSDYDEVHLYHTNPYSAHTVPGPLTDGEKILRGIDPLSTSSAPVPAQSPLTDAPVSKDLFEVDSIVAVAITPVPLSATTTSVVATTSAPITGVAFSGRALPNSFVTLYIFSTPIVVTVKTDSSGRWSYKLDKELPDGKHELYVAMVDNSGSIVAKSPAIPFTKQAEALDYQPLVLPPVSDASAGQTLTVQLLMIGVAAVMLMAGVIVVGLGLRRPAVPTSI